MPLAPGLKQIAFTYAIDADAFPLDLTADSPTAVFEVLVEDPRSDVRGAGLAPVDPVVAEGRSFKRFLASDVPAGARITIDATRPQPAWTRWIVPGVLVAIGLAMLGALARPRRRARLTAAPPTAPLADAPDALARRIAALDDAFAREPAPDDAARAAYERERAALKARLAETLAGGVGVR